MFYLPLLTILASDRLVPLVDGIIPRKTELPQLERRFGIPVRSEGGRSNSLRTWHLKHGLILQVDAFEQGKEGLVASSVGIIAWKGTLETALAANGLKTQIKPLRTLRAGTVDAAVAKTTHTILGKVPKQKFTYHSGMTLSRRESDWVFLTFGWSRDNKLRQIVQRGGFK